MFFEFHKKREWLLLASFAGVGVLVIIVGLHWLIGR